MKNCANVSTQNMCKSIEVYISDYFCLIYSISDYTIIFFNNNENWNISSWKINKYFVQCHQDNCLSPKNYFSSCTWRLQKNFKLFFLPSSNSTIIVKTNERENEKNLHLSFENNRGLFVVLSEKIAAEVAVELLGTWRALSNDIMGSWWHNF